MRSEERSRVGKRPNQVPVKIGLMYTKSAPAGAALPDCSIREGYDSQTINGYQKRSDN
ncbi:MAG: hypothetical protein ABIR33_08875 [Pyrinomonadaceae bacterium]